MFKFFIGLIFLGAAFGGSYYLGLRGSTGRDDTLAKRAVSLRPSDYPLVNHPFVFVVQGYNNGAFVEKTLNSIFAQKYDPFRVIYIDDASDDGSFELARELIYAKGDLNRVTLVRNEERLGALANVFRAVQACNDEEIVVPVNGDDWLAHEWVLTRLNHYYANPEIWLTYGQYKEYPRYTDGQGKELEESGGAIRQRSFASAQMKSFYARLFKKISESDFSHQGVFYPACCDLAYMFPMLEMAPSHSAYIGEIHYISNRLAPLREDRETVSRCERAIRSMSAYAPLDRLESPGAIP